MSPYTESWILLLEHELIAGPYGSRQRVAEINLRLSALHEKLQHHERYRLERARKDGVAAYLYLKLAFLLKDVIDAPFEGLARWEYRSWRQEMHPQDFWDITPWGLREKFACRVSRAQDALRALKAVTLDWDPNFFDDDHSECEPAVKQLYRLKAILCLLRLTETYSRDKEHRSWDDVCVAVFDNTGRDWKEVRVGEGVLRNWHCHTAHDSSE